MTVLRVIYRDLYQNSILDEHEGIKKSAQKKVLIMTEVFRNMPATTTVLRLIYRGLHQNSILDEHEGIKKSAQKKCLS